MTHTKVLGVIESGVTKRSQIIAKAGGKTPSGRNKAAQALDSLLAYKDVHLTIQGDIIATPPGPMQMRFDEFTAYAENQILKSIATGKFKETVAQMVELSNRRGYEIAIRNKK